ncbi:MAG: hypothetical protein SGJ02_12905 [bacterium]|nr:hypothetical protein [bacterium]
MLCPLGGSIGAMVSNNLVRASNPLLAAWSFFVVGSNILCMITYKFSNIGMSGLKLAQLGLLFYWSAESFF